MGGKQAERLRGRRGRWGWRTRGHDTGGQRRAPARTAAGQRNWQAQPRSRVNFDARQTGVLRSVLTTGPTIV